MKLRKTIAAILLAMLFAANCAQAAQYLDGYAQTIVYETNVERARQGLSTLRVDAELTAAARIRAEEISRSFSHTRPDGTRWITVSSAALGENIARGQKTPDKAIAAWMTSEGHRANILRASYGSIGVACVYANGVYHWVQLFGR